MHYYSLRPATCMHFLPYTLTPSTECRRNSVLWIKPINWLTWLNKRRLRNRKTNFRLIICCHSSTDTENLAKIGPVDFEIIGRKGIVKMTNSSSRRAKLRLSLTWRITTSLCIMLKTEVDVQCDKLHGQARWLNVERRKCCLLSYTNIIIYLHSMQK